ncbi:MAG TPA: GTP-binding protein [Oscillospiraceae bacterium]|nr:GTP-binding protein [Oscillospiraceae bacterium]HPF56489.1 GTP-binding protein [Clostridiales bacterium]HPK35258.1 GTP-binding protein [Oscillospiraceae bacterium]HPR75451.1 GTP-binding protein [Oscillospiraceae bacterium]
MIGLYLITGFLGAGKTVFLKGFIRRNPDIRLKIIVNEFGREGIDGALIRETGAKVEEISNGSIFCSCRIDQFEDALSEAISDQPELILVEASGLSDPTSMQAILKSDRFVGIDYLGCVCLVDPKTIQKVLAGVRVGKKQLEAADLILINKADTVSEQVMAETEAMIRELRPDVQIRRTTFGRIEPEWLENLHQKQEAGGPAYHLKDVGLQKLTIKIKDTMNYPQLEAFLVQFVGFTFRVKGFVLLDGKLSLVDCVGEKVSVSPYAGEAAHPNRIVALGGANMPMEQKVCEAAKGFSEYIESIEWE